MKQRTVKNSRLGGHNGLPSKGVCHQACQLKCNLRTRMMEFEN